MSTTIFSGTGSERDTELQGGCRHNARTFNTGVQRERARIPLGLTKAIRHSGFGRRGSGLAERWQSGAAGSFA